MHLRFVAKEYHTLQLHSQCANKFIASSHAAYKAEISVYQQQICASLKMHLAEDGAH